MKEEDFMHSRKADLMLHPVRIRIITSFYASRLTARDIAEAIPDVPQATLYRHINALVEGGILEVVEENPIRGTVERVYALTETPSLQPEDLKGMTKSDYEQAFIAFLTTCLIDARHYLDSKKDDQSINLQADGVMVSKVQVNMSDEEFSHFNQKITELVLSTTDNPPLQERKRRNIVYLVIPAN
jgi:DNA-binding transcriptional ArsR family regulator